MKLMIFSFIFVFITGCSSAPPPPQFPKGAETIVNKANVLDKKIGVIKNAGENGKWNITESIYIDKNNSIQAINNDLVQLNYLLDHANKITLEGCLESIKKMEILIKLSRNTENIMLNETDKNYCSSIVTANFEK